MSATVGRGWVALLAALAMMVALLPVTAATAQDPDPEDWDVFEQTVLTDEVQEPMSIAVLPDGRVLHNARSDDPGEDGNNASSPIRLYDPEVGETEIIAEVPVYSFSEYGGQGMALDPDFEENNWVYLYYTPVQEDVPAGEAPYESDDASVWDVYEGVNYLSRFQFVDGDEPSLDLESEQVILEVPTDLGLCCHVGGDLDFDSEGNLYLATGDDTNPFQSDNFTPIDVRENRNPGFDAQRTSANTASLSGKLLRITPQEDGSYTVPDDNMFNSGAYDDLFPEGTYDEELALPEIYAMGFRNPFRFSVDPVTDNVYVGDYGPDAGEADPERGPRATVSWHIIDEPKNIGWPYCIGNNFPFVDYDFETEESGEPFDCENPVNNSPNNTGLTELPPTTPATVWDFNSAIPDEFPELEVRGGAPMGGPVYRFDEELDSDIKFPEFYDGTAFFYEWNADYIKQFVLDEPGTSLEEIRDFLPDMDFNNPMDMEFGPDGAMYLLEYGGGFFQEHPDAQLSRITFGPDTSPDAGNGTDPDQVVTATLDPADPDGDNDWYVSPVTITLESDDDDAVLQWRVAGDTSWTTWTEPVTVDTDGVYDIEYRAFYPDDDGDNGGDNGEDLPTAVTSELTNFQFSPDDITIALGGTVTFDLVQGAHNVIIWDNPDYPEFQTSGDGFVAGQPALSGWDTFEFTPEEAGTYYFNCTPHSGMDGVLTVVGDEGPGEGPGESSDIYEVSFQLDQTTPTTTASLSGTTGADGSVYVDDVSLSLNAADATSGVVETHVREAGDEDFDVYADPLTISGDGDYTFEFRSADEAGNVEDWQSISFTIDTSVDPDPDRPSFVCERFQGGATFPDAAGSGHKFFIDCLAELGIVEGYTDGTFGPANDVSRGQLASFVVRTIELASGETMETGGSLFPDVGVNSTHGQAIYKLRNAGIIDGYTDGTFGPADPVSREQTARFVVRAVELLIDDELPRSGASFPDVGSGSIFASDIDALVTAGVVEGFTDGTFAPRQSVTRGQMTKYIGNSLGLLVSEGVTEIYELG